jgi:hypothetical protein
MPAEPEHELLFAADCPVCGKRGTVVTPDFCSEGHGGECPDRMCVDCGGAMFVDPEVTQPDTRIA